MKVEITARAVKDLDRLERGQPAMYRKVLAKIQSLASDPRAGKPLVGPLEGKWSVRVGDWRVIYETGQAVITVLTVNHRREVYK